MSNITKNLNIYKDVTNLIGARSFGKEDLVVPYRQFNGTKVGSPRINSVFIASGFSEYDYISIPKQTITNNFEMLMKIKTPAILPSGYQGIAGQITNNKTTPQLQYNAASGVVECIVATSTSSEWYGGVTFKTALNTWYWVKYIWNNGVAELLYSTNGIDYTSAGTYTVPSINWSEPMAIGKDQNAAFSGSIDLKECYININGEEVWRGVKTTDIISRNDMQNYVLSGIDVQPVINDNKAVIDFSYVKLPWKFEHSDKMQTSRFAIAPYGTTVTQTKYVKDVNGTKVGSVQVSKDFIASGFSGYNYISIFKQSFGNANNWEMLFKVKTGNSTITNQKIFHTCSGTGSAGRYGIGVDVFDNHFGLFLSSNNSSWLFDLAGSYTVLPNTTYYIKASFSGTQYKLSYSLDNVTFIDDIIYDSTSKVYSSLPNAYIGVYSTNEFKDPWLGIIDLNECYIKINNTEVWRGCFVNRKFNGTKVGSVVIDENTMIASNFAKTSYIRIPNNLNLTYNSFEMQTKILYRSSGSEQTLLGEYNRAYEGGFRIDNTGRCHMAIPNSSHTDYLAFFTGTTHLQDGEVYTVKITYNNNIYRIYINGVLDGELTLNPSFQNTAWTIGSADGDYAFPCACDIYLTDTYVKISGQEVFRGAEIFGTETLKGCIRYYFGHKPDATTPPEDSSNTYNIYAVNGDEGIVLDSKWYDYGGLTTRPVLGDGPVPTFENEWYLGEYRVETGEEGSPYSPDGGYFPGGGIVLS